MPKFKVHIYFTTFYTHECIEAESEAAAIEKARNIQVSSHELMENLDTWYDADTAVVID